MSYVWMAVIGFVVGLIARAMLPGTQNVGIVMTSLLGIGGSFLAGMAGRALGWYAEGDAAGFIASVLGAVLLLFIVGKLKDPGASS